MARACAATLVACLLLVGLPTPARAVGETLAIVLAETDGTPSWDADDAAGHDSSATNHVVRTNDTITYTVELSSTNGNADNATATLTLPRGVQFDGIPAFCTGAGSALTPATMPAPAVPATATSWTTLPLQQLVCNIGVLPQGATRSYDLVARVRPELPNGTVLPGISAAITSTAVTTPVTSAPVADITVSARAQYDLSKNGIATVANSGWQWQGLLPCVKSAGLCFQLRFPMTVSGPVGGKGLSPLTGTVTWADDLSPTALFGASIATKPAYVTAGAAAAATYGGRLLGCSDVSYLLPGPGGASTNLVTNVRNNGTTVCTQPGGFGTPVQVSTTGVDWSAYTYPTQVPSPIGTAIPADRAFVYSQNVWFEVPTTIPVDLGTPSGTTFSLPLTNTLSGLAATDLGGGTNTGDTPTNDYRSTSLTVSSSGGLSKYFVGVPGAAGNSAPSVFSPGWQIFEGPAGSTGTESGDGQLFAGGKTISLLFFSNNSTNGAPVTILGCDSWDSTKLQLTNMTTAATSLAAQKYQATGVPVWLSGWFNDSNTQIAPTNFQVEYGTGPGGTGVASRCNDSSSPDGWFADPTLVPGNDPTLLAQGIYSAVSRVRVNLTVPSANGKEWAQVSIGLRAVDGLATGTVLPNYASGRVATNTSNTLTQMAASALGWGDSSYNLATNGGNLGDRLTVASAVGRLKKEVWDRVNAGWTTTGVPEYTGGQTVDYRLSPTLTSGISASVTRDVTVEDCLAGGLNFVGASVAPTSVTTISGAMPPGANLTCSTGQTYVKWDLGPRTVNQVIAPITYTVRLSPSALPGTFANIARVTAAEDVSPVSQRTVSASIQLVQPRGIAIDKVALTPFVEVNRAGETNPTLLRWRVDMTNTQAAAISPTDLDIVDVLPKNGLAATHYTGTLALSSVMVTSGDTAAQPVQVLYTAAATVIPDPSDPTNDPSSGIPWCTSGGTLVLGTGACPASIADATGVRVRRTGVFASTDVISFEVAMVPTSNAKGDVYDNQVAARATGLSLNVGPVSSSESVVASSIGDTVWFDANGNGIHDAGETGLAGFPVALTGTDADGNAVSLSTTTDASGAYLFPDLASGTYQVTFDPAHLAALGPQYVFTTQRAGTDVMVDSDGDPTSGTTAPITLAAAYDEAGIDQGVRLRPVSVGDRVWRDDNRNGSQDAGEPGVDGVQVTLTDSSGSTTTTSGGGAYAFTNLFATRTYSLTFAAPAGTFWTTRYATVATADSDVAADGTVSFVAPTIGADAVSPADDPTLDAGLVSYDLTLAKTLSTPAPHHPGQVLTFVLTPHNAGPSTALAGWSVVDVLPAGLTATAISGSTPDFACTLATLTCTNAQPFVAGADLGTVTVTATVDAVTTGTSLTNVAYIRPGPSDGVESTPLGTPPVAGTDAAGTPTDNDASVVVPLTPYVSVGDTVFFDADRDGLRGGSDLPYVGATIGIYAGTSAVGAPVATTVTDAAGHYAFTDLEPATTYTLRMVLQGSDSFTTRDASGVSTNAPSDTADSDVDPVTGTVTFTTTTTGTNSGAAGLEDNPGIDAGVVRYDLALTKTLVTPAPYIPGQTVTYTLLPRNAGPTAALAGWGITDLLPSGMTLVSMTGSGYDCTTPGTCVASRALAAGATGNAVTVTATLAATALGTYHNVAWVSPSATDAAEVNPLVVPDTTTDTGTSLSDNDAQASLVVTPVSIGSVVWLDVDRDSVQDATEPGVAGVLVSLYAADGATLIDATVTDAQGHYAFTDLQPATTYVVEFMPPSGFSFTPQANDSSPDPATGRVAVTTPSSGGNQATFALQDDATLNAGLLSFTDLTLAKTLSTTGFIRVGSTVTFTLTPHNAGQVAALPGWSVTEVLPEGLALVGMSGPGYTCDVATATCTAAVALAAGADGPPVTVTTTLTTDQQVVNVAYIAPAPDDVVESDTLTIPAAGVPADTTATDNDGSARVMAGTLHLAATGATVLPWQLAVAVLSLALGLVLISHRRRRIQAWDPLRLVHTRH